MSVLYLFFRSFGVSIYFLASLYVYKLEDENDDDDEYIRQYFSRGVYHA